MAISLVVYGPKACGKTRNAEELMRRHGLTSVVELEEQPFPARVVQDVLYLTNSREFALKFVKLNMRIGSYEEAMSTVTA